MFRLLQIYILFQLIVTGLLHASNFTINGGINHSWVINPEFSGSTNRYFNPGFSFGINYNSKFSERINYNFGLRLFKCGNVEQKSLTTLHSTDELTEFKLILTYISSPIQMDYKLLQSLKAVVNLEPSLKLNTKYLIKNNSSEMESDITAEYENFNLFLGMGLKYIFEIYNQKFEILSIYNYGLFRITKKQELYENQIGSWADLRIQEILINIGYNF